MFHFHYYKDSDKRGLFKQKNKKNAAPPLDAEGTARNRSAVCDANAKQALVATKGGLSPPRSVLKHKALVPQMSALCAQPTE